MSSFVIPAVKEPCPVPNIGLVLLGVSVPMFPLEACTVEYPIEKSAHVKLLVVEPHWEADVFL
jgi:hypothetical protein